MVYAVVSGVIVAPRRLIVAHVAKMEIAGMTLLLHHPHLLPLPLLPPANLRMNPCHRTLPITERTAALSLTLETGNHAPQMNKSMPTLIW
jgi:hypothetical protein